MVKCLLKWPVEWYYKFPMVTSLAVPIINNENEDKIVWRTSRGECTEFWVSMANHDLNRQNLKVQWWRLVWFSQGIPKHSFIMWLAILDRLTTHDKIQKWGTHAVNRCYLCCNDFEDLQHLFFKCPFSADVWSRAKVLADIRGIMFDWQDVLQYMKNVGNSNNIKSIIRRLFLAACVYHIWQERNQKIFTDSKISSDEVFKSIVEMIKLKMLGKKVKDSNAIRDVEDKWMISFKRVT